MIIAHPDQKLFKGGGSPLDATTFKKLDVNRLKEILKIFLMDKMSRKY